MKYIFLIAIILSAHFSFGQKDSLARAAERKDSVANELSIQLKVSKENAQGVLSILSSAFREMTAVAKNKGFTREEKDIQMHQLAAKRDKDLAALLSDDQIMLLQQFFARQRAAKPSNATVPKK